MNLLVLTNTMIPRNGYGRVANDIISNLPSFQVDIFTSEKKKRIFFSRESLKSEYFNKLGLLAIVWDVILVLLYMKRKPDLIYSVAEHYALSAYILSCILRVPYVLTLHGTYACSLPEQSRLYNRAFRKADKLVCVSEYTSARVQMTMGQLPNISVEKLGVNKKVFRRYCGKRENQICFIGNHKRRKGFNILCEALKNIDLKLNNTLKVICVGNFSTESLQMSEKFFKELQNIQIKFFSEVTEAELVKVYQKSKINVLPAIEANGHFEGFGYTHVEAIACGTWSIGSYESGNKDAIGKQNGYLLTKQIGSELASAMICILTNDNYPIVDHKQIRTDRELAEAYSRIFMEIIA